MSQEELNDGAGGAPDGGTPPANEAFGFLPAGLGSLAEGHEKPESFWAEVSNLKAMAREKQAITGKPVESLVSDEERAALWKALGKPEGKDGYTLPEAWQGEGVSEEMAAEVNKLLLTDGERIKEIADAVGLTAGQAQALYGVYGTLLAEGLAQKAAAAKPVEAVLQELWPENTAKHLDAARRGAAYAGLGNDLDKAGLSENPLVLKMAHKLGELIGEGKAPGLDGPAAVLPTGEAAREEMYRIIASEGYKRNDPATMRRYEELAARVDMK